MAGVKCPFTCGQTLMRFGKCNKICEPHFSPDTACNQTNYKDCNMSRLETLWGQRA